MCGIVGCIGKKEVQDYLIGGLRRLEYRGYDSAGIATLGNDKPTLLRAKGKITELEKLVAKNRRTDQIGIGHTRWATHGEPSVRNAHPHRAGKIFLVHNGIIENYKELRARLPQHKFTSDTDSEVLAALIESFYDGKTSLVDAVTKALQLIVGTYGIAVIATDQPNQIVAARSGSPLIIGVGVGETLIASDASALIGRTKRAIYLNDGEIAVCTRHDIDIRNLKSQPITPEIEEIETDLAAIQKQGYDHFLLKEIMEQPESLARTLNGRVIGDKVKLGGLNLTPTQLRNIKHIVIVGCGTAYNAGLTASYYLSQIVGNITVEVVIASEYRYKSSFLPKNSVALIVSQSGETADTLACMREIKASGTPTLGIINSVGSTIAREVDGGIYIHAGPEISVASTKAFTSQVAAMLMFGVVVASVKNVNPHQIKPYIDELTRLPDAIKYLLTRHTVEIKKLAEQYANYEHAICLGRNVCYPVALEGALKIKEISYIDVNGYPAGELKHGALALVDDRFFELFLLPTGPLFDKSISNLQEVEARKGHQLIFTNSREPIKCENSLRVETDLDLLLPLLFNVAQQLFAYYIAVARGNDVDQPRNLAKSVTVE